MIRGVEALYYSYWAMRVFSQIVLQWRSVLKIEGLNLLRYLKWIKLHYIISNDFTECPSCLFFLVSHEYNDFLVFYLLLALTWVCAFFFSEIAFLVNNSQNVIWPLIPTDEVTVDSFEQNTTYWWKIFSLPYYFFWKQTLITY